MMAAYCGDGRRDGVDCLLVMTLMVLRMTSTMSLSTSITESTTINSLQQRMEQEERPR